MTSNREKEDLALVKQLRANFNFVLSNGAVWLHNFAKIYESVYHEQLDLSIIGITGGSVEDRISYFFELIPDIGMIIQEKMKNLCVNHRYECGDYNVDCEYDERPNFQEKHDDEEEDYDPAMENFNLDEECILYMVNYVESLTQSDIYEFFRGYSVINVLFERTNNLDYAKISFISEAMRDIAFHEMFSFSYRGKQIKLCKNCEFESSDDQFIELVENYYEKLMDKIEK